MRRLDITTGAVVTIAGRATYWDGNVDGVGSAAKFGRAWSVALDGQGALYVSDAPNNTLRKIDLATRAVTTVAGQAGNPGSTNGTGTAALFNFPSGLAADVAAGKLYIGDAHNGSIRVYDLATRNVTTLTTSLSAPDGLVLDGAGMLYVADAAGHVFAVDIGSGATTLIAGSASGVRDGIGSAAHFESIGPIALQSGALFVGDLFAMRKIDLASKQVTTVRLANLPASPVIGLVPDGHGQLLASVESLSLIARVNPADGTTAVLAGPSSFGTGNVDGAGAAARFSNPGQVVADGSGHLYVSDVDNSEVRRVDLASGAVTTFVGTAWKTGDIDGVGRAARLEHPASIASDHAGALYVVEPNDATVRKYDVAANSLTTLAGTARVNGVDDGAGAAARFNGPIASCFDGGALYVADQLNHDVRKIVVATGAVTRLAGSGEDAGASDGVGTAARFNQPSGIACDGMGYVYVADQGNDAIRRIAIASGTVDTVAGVFGVKGEVDMPGSAARFTAPTEMAFAGGFLYVVDNGYQSLHVRKIALGTWDVQTIATSAIVGQNFYGIAVDGSGNVYVDDKQFGKSIVYRIAGGALTPFAGSSTAGGLAVDGVGAAASFYDAAGMTIDGGTLWLADDGANLLRKIDLSTATVSSAIGVSALSPNVAGTGANAFVYQPGGLAFAGSDTLVVADTWTLDKVTVPGATLSIAAGAYGFYGGMDGIGSAARVFPSAVVSDGNGTFYFTGANTVRRYVASTGQVDTLAGVEGTTGSTDGTKSAALFDRPKGIAVDGAGNLYVSDTNNHTIRKVVIATGEVTTFAGAATVYGAVDGTGTDARFFSPMGIVYDGKGALYVADSENGAIRRVDVATRAVTTYAGVLGQKGLKPGARPARLNSPRGVALLPDGGLAVTDEQAVVVIH